MNEKEKHLLARVLDMDELELRAALILVVRGYPVDKSIDEAYNYIKRQIAKANAWQE